MSSIGEPDQFVVVLSGPIGLGAVDALARLQLAVRRTGGCVRLRDAPRALHDLLAFAGLQEVVPAEGDLDGRGRQAEEREEPVGVEEEADP